MNEIAHLYTAALKTDADFSAALIARYGKKNACNARYFMKYDDPEIATLAARKVAADETWLNAFRASQSR